MNALLVQFWSRVGMQNFRCLDPRHFQPQVALRMDNPPGGCAQWGYFMQTLRCKDGKIFIPEPFRGQVLNLDEWVKDRGVTIIHDWPPKLQAGDYVVVMDEMPWENSAMYFKVVDAS